MAGSRNQGVELWRKQRSTAALDAATYTPFEGTCQELSIKDQAL
jgi:hypothetical protein